MAGRVKTIARVTALASLVGGIAFAAPPERVVAAGTTTTTHGWRASLFVTRPQAADPTLALGGSTTVGARISRTIGRDVRLSFDVFNVFEAQRRGIDALAWTRGAEAAIAENYLFHPAESRGVRVGISLRF